MEGAKKELEKYLALEPEGENAEMAKNLLEHLDKKYSKIKGPILR